MRGRSAFTLIELLIVVAIIAILALIAVPNFLEAQTRAKVSRSKTDIRAIAVAWDAYHVDWNCYPRDQDNWEPGSRQNGYIQVTTPVAYITSIPRDPFFSAVAISQGDNEYAPFYEVASAVATREPYDCYCIFGLGPDRLEEFGSNDSWPASGDVYIYDPTNGTVSLGEVLRFGGSYRAGRWEYNGKPWQMWGQIGD